MSAGSEPTELTIRGSAAGADETAGPDGGPFPRGSAEGPRCVAAPTCIRPRSDLHRFAAGLPTATHRSMSGRTVSVLPWATGEHLKQREGDVALCQQADELWCVDVRSSNRSTLPVEGRPSPRSGRCPSARRSRAGAGRTARSRHPTRVPQPRDRRAAATVDPTHGRRGAHAGVHGMGRRRSVLHPLRVPDYRDLTRYPRPARLVAEFHRASRPTDLPTLLRRASGTVRDSSVARALVQRGLRHTAGESEVVLDLHREPARGTHTRPWHAAIHDAFLVAVD